MWIACMAPELLLHFAFPFGDPIRSRCSLAGSNKPRHVIKSTPAWQVINMDRICNCALCRVRVLLRILYTILGKVFLSFVSIYLWFMSLLTVPGVTYTVLADLKKLLIKYRSIYLFIKISFLSMHTFIWHSKWVTLLQHLVQSLHYFLHISLVRLVFNLFCCCCSRIKKYKGFNILDSKLLSGFPWPINGNSDNNLESLCISETRW
jgi:hypothetical protein